MNSDRMTRQAGKTARGMVTVEVVDSVETDTPPGTTPHVDESDASDVKRYVRYFSNSTYNSIFFGPSIAIGTTSLRSAKSNL